jgi:GDP-L-fucose synthase
VGSAIMRVLKLQKKSNIITRTRDELNLENQAAVREFFNREMPDQVYLAAAKVGGVHANNTYPADFIYQNLIIQANVIEAAFRNNVKKILFIGSSCIYPKLAVQPMHENALLSGYLEPTNEPYAIAKIAGIKLCESYNRQYGELYGLDYRSAMPCNLYGPGDNYHPENSHVIPALIRRFHEAKINALPKVTVWGTGLPCREFLYVDDMARACVQLMEVEKIEYDRFCQPQCSHVNIGSGNELSIKDLAETIKNIIGFNGQIEFDRLKFDGSPRKLIDSSRMNKLGWHPKVGLEEGISKAYENFKVIYENF